ncbi:MFS transporter [Pseudonocardia oroxyli]|uniref:Predicted arabinose efflux permease, MFS family n=1 Tax=Pseudonocardia oroxyli TaxID=366584 RepID=A0A1G8CD70_PSEOR|nr:MFS transporter [Pseudonocardia oroxyli]SDH43318.1 Predicted arabinose efflux permease, MFS family [Pseudonocardia oroxyli]
MTGQEVRSRAVLPICLGTGFATLIDQAILTVAVPSLAADLGAGATDLQWILAVYSLTFGLALVPAGRLGDLLGRERLLVGGLALFSAATLVGAVAIAPWMLILARVVQGVGAGTANPQVIALIQDHFRGSARTRALGAYAAVASLSGLVAPLIGGVLLAVAGPGLGWRLVVAVNIPFGLLTCAVALRTLSFARPARERRVDLDLPGVALLSLVVLGVLLPVAGAGWPAIWLPLAVAALGGLVLWERRLGARGGVPIVAPTLLRSRGFVLGTLVAMCWFGSALGLSVALTLSLQDWLGLSPLVAGLCLVPSAVAMGVTSAVGWRVVGRWGRLSVTWALGLLAAVLTGSVAALLTLPQQALPLALAAGQLLAGAAGGLVTAPNQSLTLALAPPGAHGLAAGFFQVAQRISSTVCIAACTGVVASATHPRIGLVAAFGIAVVLTVAATVLSAAASTFDRRIPSEVS